MKTETEKVFDMKEREVLEQNVRTAVDILLARTGSVSFLIPNLRKVGRQEPTFIMAGGVNELQQYAARNLR